MFNRGSLNKTRIVILGGGFAGAFAAKHLQRLDSQLTEVELINNTNYFVFQPLLPEVASGTLRAADAVTAPHQVWAMSYAARRWAVPAMMVLIPPGHPLR